MGRVRKRGIDESEPTPRTSKKAIRLRVNGVEQLLFVEPRRTLLEALRVDLGLTGTKKVCDMGECGACTVIMDGETVYSCLTLAVECEGKDIRTIEGLLEDSRLHPVQQVFLEHDGYQCGFCTPGQIMAVTALLEKNPHPTVSEVKEAVSGNLCRCGAYPKIIQSALALTDERSR